MSLKTNVMTVESSTKIELLEDFVTKKYTPVN